MLCTSVCPVGALEENNDFFACLAKLSKVSEPVLGCIRTKENSNGNLACLGSLSEEHLLVLCHTLSGELTLNLSACIDCPNGAMTPYLRMRLNILSSAGLLDVGCRIGITVSAQDIHYRDESVDRRSFFKSFRNSLYESADHILSGTKDTFERRIKYAVKRVPIRRTLLNSIKSKLSHELEARIQVKFDSCVSFDETCTQCQGCVAICPTGALQTESQVEQPRFDPLRCTGCGLCVEFCLDGAISLIVHTQPLPRPAVDGQPASQVCWSTTRLGV
jgi:ferredoxin